MDISRQLFPPSAATIRSRCAQPQFRLILRSSGDGQRFLVDGDMTRQAVAQHLAALEAANVVATVWRGREKLHYLKPGTAL